MMEKVYAPHDIETKWYQTWEKNNYFKPSGKGEPFSVILPPPNVTGSLHMGHGFGFTLMDVQTRYHRMQGKNTLWQPGTDHAGIATQMVVERQLLMDGKSRHDLGREAFIQRIWAWKEESGGSITRQLRRLGASLDWSRELFTMDDSPSLAVKNVFIKLYEEGLIYRGIRLVNWDPKLLTAISDLEVVNEEEEGKLWHIRYPLTDNSGYVVVATTRPETLLGDVAVAVNPEDERYQHLIGKMLHLPLTERMIPIIADHYVEKEFGSGCVKITPAHDFNDYAVGQRHQLEPINIFTPDAHLNENTPQKYQGLERFAARKEIINDLETSGLIDKIEKHTIKVPRGDRSGVVIEPYLTPQWYMKMQPLAAPAIQAVEKGEIKFHPENWSKTYFQWLNNIEDWCISRQLWWGHQIPAWYDAEGNVYVGESEKAIRQKHQLADSVTLEQDHDVLDTWFSSALWPFSTLGWQNDDEAFHIFYPTSILTTGFDIIFFWVARMIMMGLKFTNKVPFKDVFITGLIRDAEGHKMSKSKGNVIDPLDLIDGITLDDLVAKRTYGLMQPAMAKKIEAATRKQFPEGIAPHGTDALRFTMCALATNGREIRFDINRLEGYRNFCNKLWNAARYVLMNTENQDTGTTNKEMVFSLPDEWIFSRLQDTIKQAHTAIEEFRFDLYAQAIYEFTWNEFCDWYLELSKPILLSADSSETQLRGTRYTLIHVLETLLRLIHPIMPFITEEIWQTVAPLAGKTNKTIMLEQFPQFDTYSKNAAKEQELEWMKSIIVAIRNIRGEMNISPGKPLSILFNKGTQQDRDFYEKNHALIHALAKLESAKWLATSEVAPESSTALVGELEILIPMAGLINKEEESNRLSREISKLSKEAERAESKLENPSFIERAPLDVVEKEKAKLNELKSAIQKLEAQLKRIAML